MSKHLSNFAADVFEKTFVKSEYVSKILTFLLISKAIWVFQVG